MHNSGEDQLSPDLLRKDVHGPDGDFRTARDRALLLVALRGSSAAPSSGDAAGGPPLW